MKLIEYILGSRRGREANRLEREAMRDPFLADAIEGYDAVYGNHSDRLAELSQRIDSRASRSRRDLHKRSRLWMGIGSAAALVLVGAVGVEWWLERPSSRRIAEPEGQALALANKQANRPIERTAVEPEAVVDEAVLETAADATLPVELEDAVEAVASADATASGETLAAEPEAVAASEVATDEPALESAESEAAVEQTDVTVEPAEEPVRMATRAVSLQEREAAMEEAAVADGLRVVHNPAFEAYFAANHKESPAAADRPVEVVAEFRVNEHGVPSAVRILSGYSQEANSEVIMLLVTGPAWEPTGGERIRTVVRYE